MKRTSYDFKNKIFGFIHKEELDSVYKQLASSGVASEQIDCLDHRARTKLVESLETSDSPLTRLRIFADKLIGSGPAEFVRDLKFSPHDEYMICVDVAKKNEDRQKVFDALRSARATKVKYFHPMYTQHITTEKGHRQEIIPVD